MTEEEFKQKEDIEKKGKLIEYICGYIEEHGEYDGYDLAGSKLLIKSHTDSVVGLEAKGLSMAIPDKPVIILAVDGEHCITPELSQLETSEVEKIYHYLYDFKPAEETKDVFEKFDETPDFWKPVNASNLEGVEVTVFKAEIPDGYLYLTVVDIKGTKPQSHVNFVPHDYEEIQAQALNLPDFEQMMKQIEAYRIKDSKKKS